MRKDMKDFIGELEEMGLKVVTTGKHFKCYTSDDRWVMDFASSPSDGNWRSSALRQLTNRLHNLYGNPDTG